MIFFICNTSVLLIFYYDKHHIFILTDFWLIIVFGKESELLRVFDYKEVSDKEDMRKVDNKNIFDINRELIEQRISRRMDLHINLKNYIT